jgi:hybrid cluster-associated redox disulfide protein
MTITKDMNIRKIIEVDEDLAGILIASGMHCLGCAMSHFENLEEACAVHGIDADALCRDLNDYLESKAN